MWDHRGRLEGYSLLSLGPEFCSLLHLDVSCMPNPEVTPATPPDSPPPHELILILIHTQTEAKSIPIF